jgi:alpha-galactosidase/6-phospho-beta-glucosidase family protein
VTAAVEGSRDAALGALLAHPLVASYPVAAAILDEYIEGAAGSAAGRADSLLAGFPP